MAGIKIPGVEQIADVAPSRAPAVTANPDDFGAQIGASQERYGNAEISSASATSNLGAGMVHMADALGSLSAHLYQKQQAVQDQVYANTHEVDFAPRAAQAVIDNRAAFPDGGPGTQEDMQQRMDAAKTATDLSLSSQGYRPSSAATQHVDTRYAGILSNNLVGAVSYGSNAQIQKMRTQNDTNVSGIASQVYAGNQSADDAVKVSDGYFDTTRSLYGKGEFDKVKQAARDSIYQAGIDNAIAGKDPARARELNARYFGGAPAPGQTQADPLVRSESGGNPKLINSLGYAGAYQFGAPRLEDLGVYTPGPNENLNNWSKTPKNAPGKWSGTFNIEGFPQVKTIGDFLNNPAAQKAVFDDHIEDIDSEATKRGLDKYVGQTVGGVPITQAGIRDMAHLGGITGAEKFLTSGGSVNPADANGTKLSDYARMGARTVADSPNVGRAMANNNRIDSMDAVNRQDTQSAITDDLASISATGQGDNTLTADRITKSLGPNPAADWVTARVRAKQFYDLTQDFSTLPAEQINARVLALAAKPGQEEYAAQDALHTAASKKADAIMEARQKDPADSVSDDPQVKAAIAASGAKPDDFGLRKNIITARLAAQSRAGIYAPAPIPVDETQRLLKPLNDAVQMEELDRTKGGPSRIVLAQQQLVKDLKEKYGSYADDVMREVIGQAAKARDRLTLADAAGHVMTALINGGDVDPAATRRLKIAQEAQIVAKSQAFAAAEAAKRASVPPPLSSVVSGGYEVAPTPGATPNKKIPSLKSTQLLLNAPAADQARLAGLYDKEFGAGSAAAAFKSRPQAATGTVSVDSGGGESYSPE